MLDAVVWEVIQNGALPRACRLGPLLRCGGVGWNWRHRFAFERGIVEGEQVTLAWVVVQAFAARAEDIAAQQLQRLGQLRVFFLEEAVVSRGRVEYALEFGDAALGLFDLLLSVFGLLPSVFGLLPSLFSLLPSLFGLLLQRVVAAEQVVEQLLALLGIVGETVYDAHDMNYSYVLMCGKSRIGDFSGFLPR